SMETDARMLWWRADHRRRLTRLVMVDGSRLRWSGHEDVQIDLMNPQVHTQIELHRLTEAVAHVSGSPDASVRVDDRILRAVTNMPVSAPPRARRRNAGGHTR